MIIKKVFTRLNGASHEPYDSLNVRHGIGDNEDDVIENRQRICKELGINMGNLISLNQIHSDKILKVKEDTHGEIDDYDAMVTDVPGKFLMIQVADCQGVMIWDELKGVIGCVHNGWKGSVHNIVGKTITKMINEYQCHPSNINVLVSPSLGPCHAEFSDPKKELPQQLHEFIDKDNHVDFWAATEKQCKEMSIGSFKAEKICTVCNKDKYFSYRAEQEGTGRFAVVIGIQK